MVTRLHKKNKKVRWRHIKTFSTNPTQTEYLTTTNSDLRIKYARSAAATMTTTASASAAQRHEHFRRSFFLSRYDEWQCAQSPKSPLLFDDGKWRVFVSSRVVVVGTGGLSGAVCLKTTWTSWSRESRGAKKVVEQRKSWSKESRGYRLGGTLSGLLLCERTAAAAGEHSQRKSGSVWSIRQYEARSVCDRLW